MGKINEEWRDVPNYEGYYKVSNFGKVKSLKRKVFHPHSGFQTLKEKILKQAVNGNGYYAMVLNKDGKGKSLTAHQIVAMAFLGHEPCGLNLVVNHINFNKLDNRVENLEVVTNRENCNLKHMPSSSKYVGVSLDKRYNKWVSYIKVRGSKVHIGLYDCEKEASEAYLRALNSIKDGGEIKTDKRSPSSKYRGVSWDNHHLKWKASFSGKHIGYFVLEEEAHQQAENYRRGVAS